MAHGRHSPARATLNRRANSFARSGAKGLGSERGARHAVAAARAVGRNGGRKLALAQYPGAGDPRAGGQVRRRSRQRAAYGLALSHGLGGGAARVRTAVRPLRAPAVVLAGLALATIASTAAIFAASIASLVSARIAQSLGASTGQTIGRAIIRDLYDREHAASMIGLVTSVVVLMPMVAPLIGGIIDTLFGWEAIFVFAAVVSFTIFAWAALALPETRQLSPASSVQ